MDALPARIAALETEVTRLKEEREAEADYLARILVRIAEAERARSIAEARADSLEEAMREVEALREAARLATEAMNQATRRAELAEQSASDGAGMLDRTREELQADRARFMNLEAKLARIRREHGDDIVALRHAHADAILQVARALESERVSVAGARQQVLAVEASLASTRERLALAAGLVEGIERREEMAASIRSRALDQTRRALAGEESEPEQPPSRAVASHSTHPPLHPTEPPRQGPPRHQSGDLTLDEIENDRTD